METFISAEAMRAMQAQGRVAVVEEPPASPAKPKKGGKEDLVDVEAICPPRPGFHGFYAAGRYFPEGVTNHKLPRSTLEELVGECKRSESILTLRFEGQTVTPKPPGSTLAPLERAAEERKAKLERAAEIKAKLAQEKLEKKAKDREGADLGARAHAAAVERETSREAYVAEEAEADRLIAEHEKARG